MTTRQQTHGTMPEWLRQATDESISSHRRQEIELKYVIPRKPILNTISDIPFKERLLWQIYLPPEIMTDFLEKDDIVESFEHYQEWRLRQDGNKFFITGKGKTSDYRSRLEFQKEIRKEEFEEIISHAKQQSGKSKTLRSIKKTRRSFVINLGSGEAKEPDDINYEFEDTTGEIFVEIDDFHEVAGHQVDLDFLYCEMEVGDVRLARSLQAGRIRNPTLEPFLSGAEVTRYAEFKNANLAIHGFPATTYKGIREWLLGKLLQQIKEIQEQHGDSFNVHFHVLDALEKGKKIYSSKRPDFPSRRSFQPPSRRSFQPLRDLRFEIEDSLGRKKRNEQEAKWDSTGGGWLRDYMVITSSNPFLRLFAKPQIFRPGLGVNVTTTRGQHTLDVIACAKNIALQTGLNDQLVAAIAALHDLGHPAGGHVGERCLTELSKRLPQGACRFKHHIFSLSLSDLFEFNLLKEVQIGAFYHKSGGRMLRAPKGKPQEYGVVRIADKIAYVPWDIHDSLENGFLKRNEVPRFIYDILGKEPLDWIQTMITAVVEESAQLFYISFSERSGDIFKAFQHARQVIYEKVHTRINWKILEVQYEMAFELIRRSFPNLDPIAILAYMTDEELEYMAKFAESNPSDRKITTRQLHDEGKYVVEIIEKLESLNNSGAELKNILYYSEMRRKRIS